MKCLTDTDPFPFRGSRTAKHDFYGVRMQDVPAWYLDLCVDWRVIRERYPEIIDYVERNRVSIDAELEEAS